MGIPESLTHEEAVRGRKPGVHIFWGKLGAVRLWGGSFRGGLGKLRPRRLGIFSFVSREGVIRTQGLSSWLRWTVGSSYPIYVAIL